MKNKAWFNLVFMLLCTAFFTGILSSVYVYTRPLIEANNRLNEMRAHLNAFEIAIPAFAASTDLKTFYDQQVREEEINGIKVFVHLDDSGEPLYYGFPFSGSGLWGDIEGVIALTVDLEKIIGINFTAQNETPGLGGRIEEDWFLEQFRGVIIMDGDSPIMYATSTNDSQVDSITGATSTSDAVINILNNKIITIKDKFGGDGQ